MSFGLSSNAVPEGTVIVNLNGTANAAGVIVGGEKLQVAPGGSVLCKQESLSA
jgi:hypothetical protein